jgi:outer membrane murein-binding lipoprotein Lpp
VDGEPAEKRFARIEDFVWKMNESLKYLLQNLDPESNFNSAKMEGWSEASLAPLARRIDSVAVDVQQRLSAIAGRVDELQGDIARVRGDVEEIKSAVAELRTDVDALREDLTALQGTVSDLDDGFNLRVESILTAHGLI